MRRRLSGRVVYVVSMLMFFFKQKTAYEMRISDWSSDVCSSDLATAQVLRVKEHHPDATVVIAYPAETAVFLRDAHNYCLDGPFLATSSVLDILALAQRAGGQIGRASRREGVCQNGQIAVVAGSIRTKAQTKNQGNLTRDRTTRK